MSLVFWTHVYVNSRGILNQAQAREDKRELRHLWETHNFGSVFRRVVKWGFRVMAQRDVVYRGAALPIPKKML